MPHSILLVEEHGLLRDGIRAILEGSSEFTIVGDVSNGFDALRIMTRLNPELVLMGVVLPGIDGIESTATILRHARKYNAQVDNAEVPAAGGVIDTA